MLDFIPVVIKNVFSKPATRNYPFVKRASYDNQKGHIVIDIDSCIYCGMCSQKCPVNAINVTRAEKSWAIDRFRCIMCGECAQSCPKKCLLIGSEYTQPANIKTIDVFKAKPVEATEPQVAVTKIANDSLKETAGGAKNA